MLEKQLICLLDPLADILHRLRSDKLPKVFTLAKFGDMSLKLGTTQVLAPHSVIPLVEGDAMVVDDPCNINRPFQVAITLVLIELEL